MGKIATEQEAYNIGRKGTPTSKKCCTKSRAEALGCEVSNGYKSNQLVQLTSLSKSTVTLTGYISTDFDINFEIGNETMYFSSGVSKEAFSFSGYNIRIGIVANDIQNGYVRLEFTGCTCSNIRNANNCRITTSGNTIMIETGTEMNPDGTIEGMFDVTNSDGNIFTFTLFTY